MDDQQTAKPFNCDFSINQLSKVIWAPLKTKVPEAFHLINQMTFSNKVYQNLLNTYREHSEQFVIENRTRVYNKIACEWIRSNEHIWKKWLPLNLSNKTTIYIGGMISMTGSAYKDPGIAEGKTVPQPIPGYTGKIVLYKSYIKPMHILLYKKMGNVGSTDDRQTRETCRSNEK
jgi:hypothetical protein